MVSLENRVIAITEARRAREMAEHIAKLGGIPVIAPALREVPAEDPESVRGAIRRICAGEMAWIIFLTGVGARAVLRTAEGMGCGQQFRAALARMQIAARGPKPIAVLREAGLRVDLVPDDPTSEGLLQALQPYDLSGRWLALQLYGEPNLAFLAELEQRGARVVEMQPYAWELPIDHAPLERLVRQIAVRGVDAVAFTSSVQVDHLFVVAARLGLVARLRDSLETHVPVAAIGEVTRKALAAHGLTPQIVPPTPAMGALIVALAKALGPKTTRELERASHA